MPRKDRIHYKHAIYHVMLRGNNKQNIFHQDDDYDQFLDFLVAASNQYGAKVLLYCLMTNHVHFVIEVANIPISKIMQSICTSYAKKHNKRHNKIGHVFQGRFLSKLVHDDNYLLELCYYIHMNPLKAKMCRSLDEYKWSSHHSYAKKDKTSFLFMDHILSLLSNNKYTYGSFINKKNDLDFKYCAFDNDGELSINHSVVIKNLNRPIKSLSNNSIHKITKIVCEHFDINKDHITVSYNRKYALARSMIAYYAHYHANYSLNDIAGFFCMLTNSLSATLHRHLKQAIEDATIRKTLEALERKLSMSDTDNSIS